MSELHPDRSGRGGGRGPSTIGGAPPLLCALFLILLHAAVLGGAGTVELPPRAWLSGDEAGVPFLDFRWTAPLALEPGEEHFLPLPFELEFRGALYNGIVVGPAPGEARLLWTHPSTAEPAATDASHPPGMQVAPAGSGEGGLLLRPLGDGVSAAPGSRVQLLPDGDGFAVRWVGFRDEAGRPATFEAILFPGTSEVRYQYLQVPASMRDRPERAGVVLHDRDRGAGPLEPSRDGFVPVPGGVIVFPGDRDWVPMDGCGTGPPWCSVVGANCIESEGSTTHPPTSCSVTEAKRWHFNEGEWCESCPYTFYVVVECGTEMHLPYFDMEGNQVQITDVFTGTVLELEAQNDCARNAFDYCDYCGAGGGIVPQEPDGTCPLGAAPLIDCEPYIQRSNLIQWGFPLMDHDGDTVANELPCGPPNTAVCPGSGTNPAHETTNTDVVLRGEPALCGVFRLDILSGGWHWYLSANCTGQVPFTPEEIDQNFTIYQNCSEALAAFDPVPELVVTDFAFSGICPDIVLEVEITNIGCVDADSSPLLIDFDRGSQPDLNVDLGPVPVGTSVVSAIPVNLRATPTDATAFVDFGDQISECTEQPALSFSGCEPETGANSLLRTLCQCENTVRAETAAPRLFSCGQEPVEIDASLSSAVPCTGGSVQYRFLDGTGAVVRDWSTQPALTVSPARCPSIDTYVVEVRCSLEPEADCIDSTAVEVECAPNPEVDVTASPDQICRGETVTLDAGAGFVSYEWEHGKAGRTIEERPGSDTTFRVTVRDTLGCEATGSVPVTVLPDPLPGPMGNVLRARREGADLVFTYEEVTSLVAGYEVVVHREEAATPPCANLRSPILPDPIAMEAAPAADLAPPGVLELRHAGGAQACPRLLYYKVRALSPCTSTPGTTCDAFPMQVFPCP